MPSVFPALLSWSGIAPFLMRLALAAVLIYWASKSYRSSSREKAIGIVEGLAGLLILIGLWTQIAALVVVIDLIVRIIGKIRAKQFLTSGVNYYALLLVLALSLLLTGPGILLKFDLPL